MPVVRNRACMSSGKVDFLSSTPVLCFILFEGSLVSSLLGHLITYGFFCMYVLRITVALPLSAGNIVSTESLHNDLSAVLSALVSTQKKITTYSTSSHGEHLNFNKTCM